MWNSNPTYRPFFTLPNAPLELHKDTFASVNLTKYDIRSIASSAIEFLPLQKNI